MTRLLLVALFTSCGMSQAELSDPDDLQLSTEQGELRTNRSADRVVVYSNNLENMISTGRTWCTTWASTSCALTSSWCSR